MLQKQKCRKNKSVVSYVQPEELLNRPLQQLPILTQLFFIIIIIIIILTWKWVMPAVYLSELTVGICGSCVGWYCVKRKKKKWVRVTSNHLPKMTWFNSFHSPSAFISGTLHATENSSWVLVFPQLQQMLLESGSPAHRWQRHHHQYAFRAHISMAISEWCLWVTPSLCVS